MIWLETLIKIHAMKWRETRMKSVDKLHGKRNVTIDLTIP